jgi:hypothetical protein
MEAVIISLIGMTGAVFVLWPLLRGGGRLQEARVFPANGGRERLLEEKVASMDALKEIEFDYLSGKLSQEDYSRLRSDYENRVVRLLKKLDVQDFEDPLSQTLEREIEAARKRGSQEGGVCSRCNYPMPEKGNYCPACGTSIHRS